MEDVSQYRNGQAKRQIALVRSGGGDPAGVDQRVIKLHLRITPLRFEEKRSKRIVVGKCAEKSYGYDDKQGLPLPVGPPKQPVESGVKTDTQLLTELLNG